MKEIRLSQHDELRFKSQLKDVSYLILKHSLKKNSYKKWR